MLLRDLSKAFDCILHDLFIAWLEPHGFQIDALRLVCDYLLNRNQRENLNQTFCSWWDIKYGVPQGSILGALVFNFHLYDLLYFLNDFDAASYADDTTLYTVKENKDSVINALETLKKTLWILAVKKSPSSELQWTIHTSDWWFLQWSKFKRSVSWNNNWQRFKIWRPCQ